MPGELQGILGILMVTVPIGIYALYGKARSEKLAKMIAAAEAAEAHYPAALICPKCQRLAVVDQESWSATTPNCSTGS